jgi:hypothetical protein
MSNDKLQQILRDMSARKTNSAGNYWSLNWCKVAADYIERLESKNQQLQETVNLVHKDLKMRADDEGVVDISNFIWVKLSDLKVQ